MNDENRGYNADFDDEFEDINILADNNVKKSKSPQNKFVKKTKKKKRFFTPVFTVLLICVMVLCSWVGYVGSYIYPLLWGDLGDENTAVPTEA
ncbi:MAG: hypothetical protein Q4C00_00825, partial [Bacillota bacterium]|nr:hypothetical protein [Bacillota bacterium]